MVCPSRTTKRHDGAAKESKRFISMLQEAGPTEVKDFFFRTNATRRLNLTTHRTYARSVVHNWPIPLYSFEM